MTLNFSLCFNFPIVHLKSADISELRAESDLSAYELTAAVDIPDRTPEAEVEKQKEKNISTLIIYLVLTL